MDSWVGGGGGAESEDGGGGGGVELTGAAIPERRMRRV